MSKPNRQRIRHLGTLLLCLMTPLFSATSCVRFVLVQRTYPATSCAEFASLPSSWDGPGFHAVQKNAGPNCRLYKISFVDSANRSFAPTLLSIRQLPKADSKCDVAVTAQAPCQTRFSQSECFARSLNGEPLRPSKKQPSMEKALSALQDEAATILREKGVTSTAASAIAGRTESKSPINNICVTQ